MHKQSKNWPGVQYPLNSANTIKMYYDFAGSMWPVGRRLESPALDDYTVNNVKLKREICS